MMTKLSVRNVRRFTSHLALAGLLALGTLQSASAEASVEAVSAMTTWLKGIDAGQYGQSWQATSPAFQKAEPEKGWEESLTAMRTPLGSCVSRHLVTALYQTEIVTPQKVTLEGYFVVAEYESKFANLPHAVETVTFINEGGAWKATGYDVHARLEEAERAQAGFGE